MSAVLLPEEDPGLEEVPFLLPSSDDDDDAFDLLQRGAPQLLAKSGPVGRKKGPKATKAKAPKMSKKPASSQATVGKKAGGKAKSVTFHEFALTPSGADLKMKLLTWPGQSLAKLLPNKSFLFSKHGVYKNVSFVYISC
jgi:hypothetical protein